VEQRAGAVTLTPGVVPMISLVLRPAGGVNGDVDFLFLASMPASKAFASTVVGQTSAATTFTIQNIGPTTTGALAASILARGRASSRSARTPARRRSPSTRRARSR
jgi:hypothetical protein